MNYLAIDLGAESGRIIRGTLANGKIAIIEVYRFSNRTVAREGSLFWDFNNLTQGILTGLLEASYQPFEIQSLSVDAWGVDYVLDGDTNRVFNYRDSRGQKGVEKLLKKIPWEKIFDETGIQFMPINTLFQLASETRPIDGENAVLSIADHFNDMLGGEAVIEESMASTFQLYNPRTRNWSDFLLGELGIPRSAMPEVVPSGTVIGKCDFEQGLGTPLAGAKIVATCSHDTGCAVAAVPAEGTNWAYLSSGTWSLMGVERGEPIINEKARELNFTNEIGYGGSIRLLKNISGLWLLQECRRIWASQGMVFEYPELTRLAEREPKGVAIIEPMDARFLAPASMPEAIQEFCRERNLAEPKTPPAITRCILESLAQLYRRTRLQLEELTGEKIERLHIVGGGSKNAFLNQLTADACGAPVLAGPVEATALGNIMIQAIVSGEVASLSGAREMIGRNFPPQVFTPRKSG
jgi:rhamnulokinase